MLMLYIKSFWMTCILEVIIYNQNYKFDFICDLRITEYNNFFFDQSIKKIKMVQMGFEPTPPKRLELESSALDRSATEPFCDKFVKIWVYYAS